MNIRNHVQLMGNLGKAPELKTLTNGSKLAKASIAVENQFKNAQGQIVSSTQWLNITAWGKTAELFDQLCEKGSRVVVYGKLDSGSYESKDGTKKYYTQVVVNDFVLMHKNSSN